MVVGDQRGASVLPIDIDLAVDLVLAAPTVEPMPSRLSTSKPLALSSCAVISVSKSCSVKSLPPTTMVAAWRGSNRATLAASDYRRRISSIVS